MTSPEFLIKKGARTALVREDKAKASGLEKFPILAQLSGIDPSAVTLYIAEEDLFYTSFVFPSKTPDIKEAIRFQLDMLLPFAPEESFYSYTTQRGEDGIRICLYAVLKKVIEPHLEALHGAGNNIAGVYPYSQRFVSRNSKQKWALVADDKMPKLLVFEGTQLAQRYTCLSEPAPEEIQTLADCGEIFHPAPPLDSTFLSAADLSRQRPLLKDFNLMPASYRRTDYLKLVMLGLIALNLLGLILFAGIKLYSLSSLNSRLEAEIAKLSPVIKQIELLNQKEDELNKTIKHLEGLGKNPDLISLLNQLTKKLPRDSYLDQIRMEKKSGAIFLHGYTNNISELTGKLQPLGEIKLKSTSRRNNKTYFQLELALP